MSTTSDLTAAEYNPRKITEDDKLRLRRQLAEFGDLSGIVFNIRTDRLVGGHQRITVLQDSWPIVKKKHTADTGTVAVGYIDTRYGRFSYREVDWPEQKEKLANLAANNSAGRFDDGKLKEVLIELKEMPLLDLSGFDAPLLDKFLLDPEPAEVKDWDLGDIDEPFWIVIRGPVCNFHQIREHLRQVETVDGIVVEASL
jgi:hypothetical protein